ncbi:ABC transporter substrate-binding protein [Gryllotalpicola kribbensis]|jgi:peptide/nickel transport system substrate-binding protein|uniref:ABC transporter substrate-binding protein n=1 Tax=Gryllotalpicola kribbensis TaxID=993084 RepID=A0ABP8AFH3_9MICO
MKHRLVTATLSSITAAGVAVALAACAPTAPDSAGAASSGPSDATLTVGTTTDVVNYNPLIGNSRTDDWITDLMYPRLMTVSNTGAKEAQLATKWGYTSPTQGYYDIRSDMTWSDGTPLTAEDVAWTLNEVKKDKPAGTFYGQLGDFASAKATSKTHVEITLSEPNSSLIDEIGFWGVVVPEHVFSKAGSVATFANDGKDGGWVGAGPYTLSKVQVGQSYTLDRAKNYPLVKGGEPIAAKVVFRVFPDVNTEILALQSGEIDAIGDALPPSQVAKLKSSSGIKVEEAAGLGYSHMVYNLDNPDLAKLQVRQALSHAVDYDAIRSVVLQGQATNDHSSPIMPVLKSYFDSSLKEYSYDPKLAASLLEQAGYTKGANGKFPLNFKLIYSLQDAVTSQWATIVRDDAAKAGITITLSGTDRNTYLAATNAGKYDIYAGNFAIMDDPVTNFTLAYLPGGAINYTHVDDPTLNALIKKASNTTDEKQKISIMQQANKVVYDNVYDNIMYTQNLFFAHSTKWTGFVPMPSDLLSIVNPVSLASASPVKQ